MVHQTFPLSELANRQEEQGCREFHAADHSTDREGSMKVLADIGKRRFMDLRRLPRHPVLDLVHGSKLVIPNWTLARRFM
jgi:hypothetical protein